MKCYRLLFLGLMTSVIILMGCGRKRFDDAHALLPSPVAAQDTVQPVTVVVKRPPPLGATDQAPYIGVPDVAGPVPAVPAIVPEVQPVPGPPVPVPVPVPVDFCGDGFKQKGEDCDDGDDDNSDGCDNFCRKPRCGNNVIEGDEECDNPDHPGCTSTCTLPLCGNGEVDDGEACDPPNDTTCNINCELSECGNGEVEVGEECDDGNEVDGDGCSDSCELSCLIPQK